MSVEATRISTVQQDSVSRRAPRSRFFQALSGSLLAIVLIGFGRTLFLRPLFHVPPIPWYLYLHGAILASWFALLFVQTSLIAAHRTQLHRRLGILGALLAIAVVGLGLAAVLGFPAHFKAGRLSIDTPIDAGSMVAIVCTDFAGLAIFSTFVPTALFLRQRAAIHKRLLALASMALIFPAAARTGGVLTQLLLWMTPVPTPDLMVLNTSVQVLIVFGLPLTLVVHDLRAEHGLHRATTWGLIAYYVAMFGALAVAFSPAGRLLIGTLE